MRFALKPHGNAEDGRIMEWLYFGEGEPDATWECGGILLLPPAGVAELERALGASTLEPTFDPPVPKETP